MTSTDDTVDVNLSDEQLSALRRIAAAQKYHLLLGAGASLDSRSEDGRGLPNGRALAIELAEQFGVETDEGDQLWTIYDRACHDATRESVYQWLRGRFHNVHAPAWMGNIARFGWETVWTLNLDDSFESKYREVKTEASRDMKPVNWDDPYEAGRKLLVVHLHGHVGTEKPRKLVFSLPEYASVTGGKSTWPLIFRDLYGVTPFVIIGARLVDEPDLKTIIAGRQPETAAPSFYVSPSLTTAQERDLERWNLIPIKANAEQFTALWAKLTGLDLTKPPVREEEYFLQFGRQFGELGKFEKKPREHDFIGGDAPRWSDILDESAATFGWHNSAKKWLQIEPATARKNLLVFTGRRLSGRSAGLLIIANMFRNEGWRTFRFRGEELPDPESILGFASDGKPVVLVIDGISDIATELEDILAESIRRELRLICLAVDLTDNDESILGRINSGRLIGGTLHEIPRYLDRQDAASIVAKLEKLARLGELEKEKNYRKRIYHFDHKELFNQMAVLEDAPGFGRRVQGEVTQLKTELDRFISFIVALANFVDKALLTIDAARMCGLSSDDLIRRVRRNHSLNALVHFEGPEIQSRQRWMALQYAVKELGAGKALQLLGTGISKLAPRLGDPSRRQRTATSLLVGALMGYKTLDEVFPGQDLEKWYNDLRPVFGDWNGRYWEQRAIMCRNRVDEEGASLARAQSFSERAVTLKGDVYSYTTLATTLLVRASYDAANGYYASVDGFYSGAFDAFEEANKLDERNLVTWMAYLRHALPVASNLLGAEDGHHPTLEKLISDWEGVATWVGPLTAGSENMARNFNSLQTRFRAVKSARDVKARIEDGKEPKIVGDPKVGGRMKLDLGEWKGVNGITIQWLRGRQPIANETREQYAPTATDAGFNIRARVRKPKPGYAPEIKIVDGPVVKAELSE